MKIKFIASLLLIVLSVLMMVSAAFGRQGVQRPNRAGSVSTPSASINLNRVPENPSEFSLIVSDGEEQIVSGMFEVEQLKTVRDIMLEAKKFAFSEESVGKDEPITTRFASDESPAFVVDVVKFGTSSQIFITYSTENGVITVDAGTVYRNNKQEQGLFFNFLSRLESSIPKQVGQSSK